MAALPFFKLSFFHINQLVMASLLIITPYKVSSTISIQESPFWTEYANAFAAYKTRTGVDAEVMSLWDINIHHDGRDEAENVKKAIYTWATAKWEAGEEGLLGVMLVGDAGIFPVRYLQRGYTEDHDVYQYCEEGEMLEREAYQALACDAYFAVLKDPVHPGRDFDDWDYSENDYFGEMYYNNIRATDINALHSNVAVGRILCRTPEEFQLYLSKVRTYETTVADASFDKKMFLVSGRIGDSETGNGKIGEVLADSHEITHLYPDESGFEVRFPSGSTERVYDTERYVSNYINNEKPQVIHYFGHAGSNSWSCVGLRSSDVDTLANRNPPAIVLSIGCRTAFFANESKSTRFPETPYTGSPADRKTCIAESFLNADGGGIIYIGVYTGGNNTNTPYLTKSFIESFGEGVALAGDAWINAQEAFIDHYEWENFRTTEEEELPKGECGDEEPTADTRWQLGKADKFYQLYSLHFFGDPTLRLNGVADVTDGTPPVTSIITAPWINREDLRSHIEFFMPYSHDVEFVVTDPGGSGVMATYYRHRRNNRVEEGLEWAAEWGSIHTGTHFSIPIGVCERMEGWTTEIEYWSVDHDYNIEAKKVATIGYDYTPPVSTVYLNGEPVTDDRLSLIELGPSQNLTIRAVDEGSGVRELRYRVDDAPFESVRLGEIELGRVLGRCFPRSVRIEFYAVDVAGNAEPLREMFVDVRSYSYSVWKLLCTFEYKSWIKGLFTFPVQQASDTIFLEYKKQLDLPFPDDIRFDYLGPVSEDPDELNWHPIGKAIQNIGKEKWEILWDTRAAGIKNGFYWVRSVGDSHLMFINNFIPKKDYTFQIGTNRSEIKPGEKIQVQLVFKNQQLKDLHNVKLGLVTSRKLWEEKSETAFIKSIQCIKQGETRQEVFELSLKNNLSDITDLQFHACLHSEEVTYLQSKPVRITALPKNIQIKGRVRDNAGKPFSAMLELRQNQRSWKTLTNKKGGYLFENIEAGPYALSILRTPDHYKQLIPERSSYLLNAEGKDIRRDFVLAPASFAPPVITAEFLWEEAIQDGKIFGLTYGEHPWDEPAKVELAVEDKFKKRWWTPDKGWTKRKTWFAPHVFTRLDIFLDERHPQLLNILPVRKLEKVIRQLSRWYRKRKEKHHPNIWGYDFGATVPLADGWKVLCIRAGNENGDFTETEIFHPNIVTDFGAYQLKESNGLAVQFVDQSEGVVLDRSWDFGDGQSGRGARVRHDFSKPGKYVVKLEAAGPYSSVEITKEIEVMPILDS
jgi:hypothetical protein